MKRIITLAIAVFLICSGMAFADHPLITDEAETLDRGGFEVELNGEFAKNDEEEDDVDVEETEYELEAEFAYGLLDRLEVYVEAPYMWVEEKTDDETGEQDGIGDIEAGLRWQFLEADDLGLSVKPFVIIPTGDEEKGLGNGKTSYGIIFIASHETDPVALHLNVGYTRNEYEIEEVEDESRNDIFHASIAAEWNVVEALRIVGNVGIETNQDKESDDHPAFALAGVIYDIGGGFAIDAGVKIGITEPEDDYAILAGVSYEFEPGSGPGDGD